MSILLRPTIRIVHRVALAMVIVQSVSSDTIRADEQVAAANASLYLQRIKPILKARCFACHGALKQESGLRLDTAAQILAGSTSGPVAIIGAAAESPVLARVTSSDPDVRMPPEGEPLTADQVDAIANWIQSGANGPEHEQPEADPRDHWSFRPLQRPIVPQTQVDTTSAAQNPIDAFVNAKLAEQRLSPLPAAAPDVQLRRLYLDLIGLPPTRDELLAFFADESPDAYARVVDRLLDDPRHSERWARHWMDVWRYADWYGRRSVPDVWNSAPQIWRWRDWIVNSLNEDRGYDRMIHEMLAADEICPEDDSAAVATGFLIRNWYALNPNDWMRNTVEHTGKAFLGLTFNCAHCHDHKYDPIAQDDYFRLRAFFEPMNIRQDQLPGEADPGPFQEYEYVVQRKVQRLGMVRIYDHKPDAPTWFYSGGDERNRATERGSMAPGVPEFLASAFNGITPVEMPLTFQHPEQRPAIVAARQTAAAAPESAEPAPAAEPRVFPATSTGRRRALALWITSEHNPLTARVAVNHIWMRHFHSPLVSTVFDFGRNGAAPTHPELLDWLACELRDHQWSMKRIHRLIVTSDAYRRQSGGGLTTEAAMVDPDNRWLWRMNVGRMEAEVVRDSLLFVAGKLDLTRGGQELENSEALTTYRRSLYYSSQPEGDGRSAFGLLFDAPDALDCYRRTESIIPQQALALTNSELVHAMAKAVSDGAGETGSEGDLETRRLGDGEFVEWVFETVLSRGPSKAESAASLRFLSDMEVDGGDADEAARHHRNREGLIRALMNHSDFVGIR